MESAIILCAFLAANIALCGLAWGQSQGCPCAECSVQRNNEHTCPAGDVKFFETDVLTTQKSGPQMFAQQNATYVSTHLTFSCSGYIQRVEIQAKGDESLQNVTLDLHLWRMQNNSQNNSTLLFQQLKRFTMNFNVTFTSESLGFIVLSANISERNQSQFHFDEGDILGFTIPANSPVNVTSSDPEEPGCPVGKNMTYLLSVNCTPADSSSVCAMPRIGITFGSLPGSPPGSPSSSPSGSPSSSLPLLTSSSTPSTPPSFSVPPSLPSRTSSPAGVSQMTPNKTEPTSPTSSQANNDIFIILGATLGSSICALLIIAIIILVICILQRRKQSAKWTHSNKSEFKSSSTGASNPLSITGNTRLERLASVRHQHAGTAPTTSFECQVINDHYYDAPMEAIASYRSQVQENTHFYHVLESPSSSSPASPTRVGSDSQSASSVDSPKKYLTMHPPGSTPAGTWREVQPLILEEEDTSSVGYHRPTELEAYEWRKNKSENDVENIFYQFTEQSAKQLEQSKSKDEVINTFYQAGGQQRRVDYDIPVELMGKTTGNRLPQVFKPTAESLDQTATTSKQLFHHQPVLKGEGEQQIPVHFYHTLEPTVEDEITGHQYHILEPDDSEDGSKGLESHQVFEFGIYVPDTEERKRLTGGRGELIPTKIYDDWSQKQREESTKRRGFFEHAPVYWKPAEVVSGLYDQLARKKFREILREQLVLEEFLGNGQFGSVSKATWNTAGGSKKVAVKIMRPSALDSNRVKFLQEAAIMGQFFHSNVVKLHGVVTVGEPAMIVLELMPFGDLAAYLKKNHNPGEKPPPNPRTLLSFCRQVACGMGYLSRKGFVHRDLAARNILLNESLVCKISDFGMSRELDEESAYYISSGGNVPIKWTAPEALVYKKYSTASDVYSYGMLLYEIWSLGLKPLAKLRIAEVPKKVSSGYCQPPPPGCPREIYQLMVKCWNPAYSARPTFGTIFGYLNAPDGQLLKWSEEDRRVSHRAAELGAPLTEGSELYNDLQITYQLD